jgi:transposase-like protein
MKEMSQDKPRRTFTPEFKLNIVKEANADQSSISAIAHKYDLNANQVFRWCHEVKQNKVRWVRIVAAEQVSKSADCCSPKRTSNTGNTHIRIGEWSSGAITSR